MHRTWNFSLRMGAAAFLAVAGAAGAVTPIPGVTSSPDVTTTLRGQTVGHEQALDEPTGLPAALLVIPGIPNHADLAALDEAADGALHFASDITISLPGGLTTGPRDVVRWDGAVYSIVFAGATAGIPSGARIDAIASEGSTLLLSLDVSASLPGGIAVDDEDVVSWDGSVFALVFDASSAGVATSLDLDGLSELSNAHLLVSFDTSGSVGGVPFDDEDVLEWTGPAPGTWEMAYDGSLVDANWSAADLDAVSVPGDLDADGVADTNDNCRFASNPDQLDRGGIGVVAPPDGIGDVCQCGDVTGDGKVTIADAVVIQRALLIPPTATQTNPQLCNVGGNPTCSVADAVIIRRANLVPATATVAQVCAPALP